MNDGRRTCLSHMFEAVGSYYAGKLDEAGLEEYENNACPTCGSCSGMYTANSMNCLTEAIGMGLRGNGTIPAVWSARLRLAKHAGMQIMELVERDIRPRDIMTEAAFHNAETDVYKRQHNGFSFVELARRVNMSLSLSLIHI